MLKNITLAFAFSLTLVACQGTRPDGLGVREGQLQDCPSKPNCVFSQSVNDDQKVTPLPLKGSPQETMQALVKVIKDMERTQIIEQKDDYLRVEFKSSLLQFVDDVEFYIPEGKSEVQTRSASRLGHSDLGVNRKRIESIRQSLEKK